VAGECQGVVARARVVLVKLIRVQPNAESPQGAASALIAPSLLQLCWWPVHAGVQ
jgi:hypothetical protein